MSFEEKHVRNEPVFFCMPSLYRGRDCKNIWLKWRIRIVKSAANILFCIFLLLLYFILGRGRKRWCFLLDGSLENHLPHVCMSLCNETVQGRRPWASWIQAWIIWLQQMAGLFCKGGWKAEKWVQEGLSQKGEKISNYSASGDKHILSLLCTSWLRKYCFTGSFFCLWFWIFEYVNVFVSCSHT